ncbi:MAG TPA: undecaprenyl-diphosphate phosphatase [Bryobacteraceae bacterium]|jgi:undecaprenyl-diphosphatase|nr:undecaprenyl-diphosphate phosphatase [Bryobacteraceae bacterium]
MPILQVVILALVQGITEFLPISSTAHLALAPWLLGWKDAGLTFDIALHVGTLAAVLLFFFRDWLQVIAQGFGLSYGDDPQLKQQRMLLWFLAAASIPIGVVGFIFKEQAEEWRNPFLIGGMLIGIGLVMWLAERAASCKKGIAGITLADSALIGAAQALAVIPGTSRSGITIAAALFRGLDRPAAARFSFLLSTPAIAGAAASALHHLMKQGGIPQEMRLAFGLGIAVSALSGCAVIAFFLKYLQRHTLRFFIYYRLVFGIIVIALALFRRPAG